MALYTFMQRNMNNVKLTMTYWQKQMPEPAPGRCRGTGSPQGWTRTRLGYKGHVNLIETNHNTLSSNHKTHRVENGSRNELGYGVESHVLECTKRCHQSSASLPTWTGTHIHSHHRKCNNPLIQLSSTIGIIFLKRGRVSNFIYMYSHAND